MDDSQAQEAARLLHAAWRDTALIPGLPESCRPQNLDDGYQIQDALEALHDAAVVGYKIGATNEAVQRIFDVDSPFFGLLLQPALCSSPATIPAGKVILHIIEAEFDFTLKEDLPPRDGSYSQDEVMARVENLIPAIEIPDSRYENWREAGMAQLVADNAIASLLVLGEPAQNWRALDLSRQSVAVKVNGETVDEGSGANVLGDPRNALTWLANTLSARGMGLKAGQIVTTGSAANVIKVNPGDTVVADFGDLGVAEVHFG